MVSISHETPEQTEVRLRSVLASAEFVALPGDWAFHEADLDNPPGLTSAVLAVVRDDQSWSWLTTAAPHDAEQFALFSFHFPPGLGQQRVRRVAGHSAEAGARDGRPRGLRPEQPSRRHLRHWGCPVELRDDAAAIIDRLRST